MTTEENKELVRRMFEVVNTGNLAVLDEIISPDYVNHPNEGEPATAQIPGQEAAKEFVRWLRRAFPDIQITVEDQIAEGDKVVTRYTARGTHWGKFSGVPSTGTRLAFNGIEINRLAGGKLMEGWAIIDLRSIARQLGVFPPRPGRLVRILVYQAKKLRLPGLKP